MSRVYEVTLRDKHGMTVCDDQRCHVADDDDASVAHCGATFDPVDRICAGNCGPPGTICATCGLLECVTCTLLDEGHRR